MTHIQCRLIQYQPLIRQAGNPYIEENRLVMWTLLKSVHIQLCLEAIICAKRTPAICLIQEEVSLINKLCTCTLQELIYNN